MKAYFHKKFFQGRTAFSAHCAVAVTFTVFLIIAGSVHAQNNSLLPLNLNERQSNASMNPFASKDLNGDGNVTAEEAKAASQNNFGIYDSNGDGRLTVEEIEDFVKSMQDVNAENARNAPYGAIAESLIQQMGYIDQNGDGIISLDEYSNAQNGRMDSYDLNRDGVISDQEARFVSAYSQAVLKNSLRDGDISETEQVAQIQQDLNLTPQQYQVLQAQFTQRSQRNQTQEGQSRQRGFGQFNNAPQRQNQAVQRALQQQLREQQAEQIRRRQEIQRLEQQQNQIRQQQQTERQQRFKKNQQNDQNSDSGTYTPKPIILPY